MQIVFVRHTSVDVPRGTCYGQTDVPLAPSFPEEAASTRDRLAAYKHFDAVYSSPLSRAVRLANFCGYDAPTLDNRLKEMNMGDWEMKKYDEIDDPNLAKWYADYMHERTTGGESFPDLYQRVASFLDELLSSNYQRVVVFAHAGVLMAAGIYAKCFTETDCFEHQTPYGGVMEINF